MLIIDQLRKLRNRSPRIWMTLERINGLILILLTEKSMRRMIVKIENCLLPNSYTFKHAENKDAEDIARLLSSSDAEDVKYFNPFDFDTQSILHVIKCGTYLCFMVIVDGFLVGFFFLRISFNRKSFLGFYIDKAYRGLGLGKQIISTLAEACVENGIALYSSVSELNVASMKAHESNGFVRLRKTHNNYWLLGVDNINQKREGAVHDQVF